MRVLSKNANICVFKSLLLRRSGFVVTVRVTPSQTGVTVWIGAEPQAAADELRVVFSGGFVASGVSKRFRPIHLSLLNDRIARDDHYTVIDCYGFGLPCPTFTITHPPGGMACGTPNDSAYVLNSLVNGFVLLGVYVLSESIIRRREARKP